MSGALRRVVGRVSDVAEALAVSAPVPGREERGFLLDYLRGQLTRCAAGIRSSGAT